MNRGDVIWHKFKEPDKIRPVLILTRNEAISQLNALTVVPITSTIRGVKSQVILDEGDGMREVCALNLDWTQTVPKRQLKEVITRLSEDRMEEVLEALKFAFGFDK